MTRSGEKPTSRSCGSEMLSSVPVPELATSFLGDELTHANRRMKTASMKSILSQPTSCVRSRPSRKPRASLGARKPCLTSTSTSVLPQGTGKEARGARMRRRKCRSSRAARRVPWTMTHPTRRMRNSCGESSSPSIRTATSTHRTLVTARTTGLLRSKAVSSFYVKSSLCIGVGK